VYQLTEFVIPTQIDEIGNNSEPPQYQAAEEIAQKKRPLKA
jgi:hypothetical protein